MINDLNIINSKNFMKSIQDMDSGKKYFAEISSKDFELKHFEIRPVDECLELPNDFPNCCEFHRSLLKSGIETYNKFPYCCKNHEKLKDEVWFKKEDYSYIIHKIPYSIEYTFNCIKKSINNENWYKEITDYITYAIQSFGQFPDGYGSPLGINIYFDIISNNINSLPNIPTEKIQKIKEFLQQNFKVSKKQEEIDINLLASKYKEWLKIFPFELSYFNHLKAYFENQMPLVKQINDTNIYTRLTACKILSKKELIDFLVRTTQIILKEINGYILFNQGKLMDIKQVELELILGKRKIEVEEIDINYNDSKKEYIKVIKKWLYGEKQFINEIKPFLKQNITLSFIYDLISGIKNLQDNDINEQCIINVRDNNPNKETSFRYWFKNFFSAKYPNTRITAEEEKGNGRIDLKISHKEFGDKLIEFKGWWNWDKKQISQQICSYLTDFEKDGYVFMINHLKEKSIICDYKNLIISDEQYYVENSWKEHQYGITDFTFYESRHKFTSKEKTVYHFIFNVYF